MKFINHCNGKSALRALRRISALAPASHDLHESDTEAKKMGELMLSHLFWSKWRDSNSRPPVPEQIHHRFLTTFVDFLVLFSPKTMLSDALVRTVST